jgi:pyruvate kinase
VRRSIKFAAYRWLDGRSWRSGVELPAHEVPLVQKELIRKAKMARIPVIVATQMMETMITSLTPTRAEVNDVANSVMDGDAVMLWRNCRELSCTSD